MGLLGHEEGDGQVVPAYVAEGAGRHGAGHGRLVALLGEVRQDQATEAGRAVRGEGGAGLVVGKVAGLAGDAGDERERATGGAEHLRVVVRFQHQTGAADQRGGDLARDEAQVGEVTQAVCAVVQRVGHRLGGVVADAHACYGQPPQRERHARLEDREVRRRSPRQTALPLDDRRGSLVGVDRHLVPRGEALQPRHMVGVLVGDEDAIEPLRLDSRCPQPLLQRPAGKPRVNQHPRPATLHIGGVALAPGSQNANSHAPHYSTPAHPPRPPNLLASAADAPRLSR